MGDTPRNHLVAMLGEFAGTFLFLFFAFAGTQTANLYANQSDVVGPNPSVLLYISLSFGFSLAVNVWVFFRISGGAFNPAVSKFEFSLLSISDSQTGHSCFVPHWCRWLAQGRPRGNVTDSRWNHSSGGSVRFVSWWSACSYLSQPWHKSGAWSFHRNVPHYSAHLYNVSIEPVTNDSRM